MATVSIRLGPPDAAKASGYTTLKFASQFNSLSVIDNNNTKATGYQWYMNNYTPSPVRKMSSRYRD